jgi:hypothetical protein
MKESIKTVFQCDFCDKRLFRKDAMERHELICSRNPVNNDACHGCTFCEEYKKEITVEGYNGDFYEYGRMVRSFKCNKLNVGLYPHKALNLFKKYPENFEDEMLMPNSCEHFELHFN